MLSLLERLLIRAGDADKALADSVTQSREDLLRSKELDGRVREAKIASSLPQIERTSTDGARNYEVEPYLQTLRELEPEAEKHFISNILKRYYGLKTPSTTADDLVDFSSVDDTTKELVSKTDSLKKTINHYIQYSYHESFSSNCKALEYLAEVGLLNQDTLNIYESALTKINETFHKRSLRSVENYSFTLLNKYVLLPVIAPLTVMALAVSGAGGYESLVSSLAFLASEVVPLGHINRGGGDGSLFGLGPKQYRTALLKHLSKHEDTFEIDLPVALQSAKELQEQLLHPQAIKESYNTPVHLARIGTTLPNSIDGIKRSIDYLTRLNNPSQIFR